MPFLGGQVGFCRLRASLPTAATLQREHLDKCAEHTIATNPTDAGERPGEVEFGWTGGEHIEDNQFSLDKNAWLDGQLAHLGVRVDTNKVPAEVARAIRAREAGSLKDAMPGMRESKKLVREAVDRAIDDERATGKHKRSKMVPLLWDLPRKVVLCATGAQAFTERLANHWRVSFGAGLSQMSSGALAADYYASKGLDRRFEDMRPSRFVDPPAGRSPGEDAIDPDRPEVPWASVEPADFLGNEFLLWVWRRCETGGGRFEVTDESGAQTEVAIAMDRLLEMECAWGFTGKQTLTSTEEGIAPVRMPEAARALQVGKWPRRAGLILAGHDRQYTLSFQADRWLVSGVTLPRPTEEEEATMTEAGDRLEARLAMIRRLDELLLAMFREFLAMRASDAWPGERERISAWIRERAGAEKQRRAVAPAEPVEVHLPEDAHDASLAS